MNPCCNKKVKDWNRYTPKETIMLKYGDVEESSLADLVVLTANPLDDIQNTDDIEYIMLNGRMYDPVTMDEVVTGDAERSPYFWE